MNNTIRLSVISSVNDHDSVSKLILYYNDYNPEGMGWGKREQNKNEKKKIHIFLFKNSFKNNKEVCGRNIRDNDTNERNKTRGAISENKVKNRLQFVFLLFFLIVLSSQRTSKYYKIDNAI